MPIGPPVFIKSMEEGRTWHGIAPGSQAVSLRRAWTPEQRLADMDSLGVDVHVVSTGAAFYNYDLAADVTGAMHRECNDEVRQMTLDCPDWFKGFAQTPIQDVGAAIDDLERTVVRLGILGAMINDTVNGRTFDHPDLLPLWVAADQMGAVMFVHQGGDTLVAPRTRRYLYPIPSET